MEKFIANEPFVVNSDIEVKIDYPEERDFTQEELKKLADENIDINKIKESSKYITRRNNTMKILTITKKQYNESKYFQTKYGRLTHVSESGKIYKTSKGNLIKFMEAKSIYDGIENALETLKQRLDEDTSDMARVAALKQKVSQFTL